MNLRILSITVAILVALCATVWFVRRPSPPTSADPRVGHPVLASDLATQAAQVKLSDQGKTVELVRTADGSWNVASYHDFPADFAKLSRLVNDLTEAKIRRLVTARADRLPRLEFKDTTITLRDTAEKELWGVTLGKNADAGGRYLRYGTEEKGYLANLSLWLDAEPKNWANTVLLSLKPDTVARLELSFADGTNLAVSRLKKEESWAPVAPTAEPEGKRLKSDRINSILSPFSELRFTDTTATDDEKAVAARGHTRTIKFTTFDQKTYTITLSRKPEEKKPKATSVEGSNPGETASTTKPAESDPNAKPANELASPTPATPSGASEATKEPEFETIPAGPVFISISSSEPNNRVNALMQKRAFQIADWPYTALPVSADDLWEQPPSESKPAETPSAAPSTEPKPETK